MISYTSRHLTKPADYLSSGRSRSERLEDGTSAPLNSGVAWGIFLLVSLGLWWGIWSAVSLLISALL